MTPRKAAGDEHVSSSRNGRNAPKSTSTGSMMGLVRAAAAVRRSKKDGLVRRSADHRGEFGPGIRVSAGSKPDFSSHLNNMQIPDPSPQAFTVKNGRLLNTQIDFFVC